MTDPDDPTGFRKVIDKIAEERKRQEQAATSSQLTATLEDGTQMPFKRWARRWVAEAVDGRKFTNR